jgi:AcrR family transcriptional regulator
LTKGAIYHHFSSKEDLCLAMLHRDLAEKQTIFHEAASTPGSSRERLGRLTRSFLEMPREKRRVMRLVRRDINVFSGPERERLVQAYQNALPVEVENILQEGIRNGELASSDPRLLSWQFVALVEVALSPYADTLFGTVDEKLNQVLDLFLDGASVHKDGVKQ